MCVRIGLARSGPGLSGPYASASRRGLGLARTARGSPAARRRSTPPASRPRAGAHPSSLCVSRPLRPTPRRRTECTFTIRNSTGTTTMTARVTTRDLGREGPPPSPRVAGRRPLTRVRTTSVLNVPFGRASGVSGRSAKGRSFRRSLM